MGKQNVQAEKIYFLFIQSVPAKFKSSRAVQGDFATHSSSQQLSIFSHGLPTCKALGRFSHILVYVGLFGFVCLWAWWEYTTVASEMLAAVACDQSVQLKVAWCCRRNLSAFFKIFFCFVLLYDKSLNDWSLGKQWILFPSNLIKILRFSGDKIRCSSPNQSLSVFLGRIACQTQDFPKEH